MMIPRMLIQIRLQHETDFSYGLLSPTLSSKGGEGVATSTASAQTALSRDPPKEKREHARAALPPLLHSRRGLGRGGPDLEFV